MDRQKARDLALEILRGAEGYRHRVQQAEMFRDQLDPGDFEQIVSDGRQALRRASADYLLCIRKPLAIGTPDYSGWPGVFRRIAVLLRTDFEVVIDDLDLEELNDLLTAGEEEGVDAAGKQDCYRQDGKLCRQIEVILQALYNNPAGLRPKDELTNATGYGYGGLRQWIPKAKRAGFIEDDHRSGRIRIADEGRRAFEENEKGHS